MSLYKFNKLVGDESNKEISIEGKEVRSGEYELQVTIDDLTYTISSKETYKKDDIIIEILEKIIVPHIYWR